MRKISYTTLLKATTSNEAESLIKRLQAAGFHPAELALTATLPIGNKTPSFPVEVPTEEADKAQQELKNKPERRASR